MNQTKRQSFIESLAQVGVGFMLSFIAGFAIYPICGLPVSIGENLGATALFTFVSLTRQYIMRRWFNKHIDRLVNK
jgi:hypothetical protein